MAKVSDVLQKPEECPADFYERLFEVFRVNTPFDPEAPPNPVDGQCCLRGTGPK